MSVLAARAAWKGLSPAERDFVEHPRLDGSASPDEWLARLAGVVRYDGFVNRVLARLMGWGIGGIGLGVALFIVGGFLSGPAPHLTVPVGLLAIAAALFGVASFVYRYMWSKVDVPDVLAETVLPLLSLMAMELPDGDPVQLTLDLRGSELDEKKHDYTETGSWSSLPHHKNTFYLDPWLQLDATLVDGSRMRVSIRDVLRVRKTTKRSQSGKRKMKTKHKVKRRIRARLSVRPDRGLEAVGGAHIRVRHGGKRQHITAEARYVADEALFSTPPDALVQVMTRCFVHTARRPEPPCP